MLKTRIIVKHTKYLKSLIVLCVTMVTVFGFGAVRPVQAEMNKDTVVTLDTIYVEMTNEEIEEHIIEYLDTIMNCDYKVIDYEKLQDTEYLPNSSEFTGVYQDKTRNFYPPGQASYGSTFPNGGSISYDPSTGGISDSWGVSYAGVSYTVTMPRGTAQVGYVSTYNYNVPPTNSYVRLYMTRVDRSNFYKVTSYTQDGTVVHIVPVTGLYSLSPQLIYS